MTFVNGEIEEGTINEQARVTHTGGGSLPPPQGENNDDLVDDTDEEPDVDDIEVNAENIENGVHDNISAVTKHLDEETCMDMLRSYYSALYDQELPPECRCSLQGCEFDYSSNTYRIQATLNAKTVDIATHYLVVKLDYAEGFPKICSIR